MSSQKSYARYKHTYISNFKNIKMIMKCLTNQLFILAIAVYLPQTF